LKQIGKDKINSIFADLFCSTATLPFGCRIIFCMVLSIFFKKQSLGGQMSMILFLEGLTISALWVFFGTKAVSEKRYYG